ncbi:hypothetical protein HK100_000159, partial [Physocladia obscura]
MCVAANGTDYPIPLVWSPCNITDSTQHFLEVANLSLSTAEYLFAADATKAVGLNPDIYSDNWNQLFLVNTSAATIFQITDPVTMINLTMNLPADVNNSTYLLPPAVAPSILNPPIVSIPVVNGGPFSLQDATCVAILQQNSQVNVSSLWSLLYEYNSTTLGIQTIAYDDASFDFSFSSNFRIESIYTSNNTYQLRIDDNCVTFDGSILGLNVCLNSTTQGFGTQLLAVDCYSDDIISENSPLNCSFKFGEYCFSSGPNQTFGGPLQIIPDSSCGENFTVLRT